jgi:hypothetical protein
MTYTDRNPSAKMIETYKGIPIYVAKTKVKAGTTQGYSAGYGDDFLGNSNTFTELYAADAVTQCRRDIDAQLSGGWGVGSPDAISRRSAQQTG